MVNKLISMLKLDTYSIVIYLIILCFTGLGLVFAFGPKVIVCANVFEVGEVRGRKVYRYKYFVKEKGIYRTSSSHKSLLKNLDIIFDADCVKIVYNSYFPSSTSIIDERFKK